jgi:hypothetical protein
MQQAVEKFETATAAGACGAGDGGAGDGGPAASAAAYDTTLCTTACQHGAGARVLAGGSCAKALACPGAAKDPAELGAATELFFPSGFGVGVSVYFKVLRLYLNFNMHINLCTSSSAVGWMMSHGGGARGGGGGGGVPAAPSPLAFQAPHTSRRRVTLR